MVELLTDSTFVEAIEAEGEAQIDLPPRSPSSVAISRSRNDWIVGSAAGCSQIHSLNESSFDPAGAGTYLGGTSARIAFATVSRASPVSRATSRCERPSTSTIRLISAHRSTPTTHSSRSPEQARLTAHPDTTARPRPQVA